MTHSVSAITRITARRSFGKRSYCNSKFNKSSKNFDGRLHHMSCCYCEL